MMHMKSSVIYTGPSMNPTLRQGDIVEIISAEKTVIIPGDIIYFLNQKNTRVIHRVIKHTENGYITKGDNNKEVDSTCVTPDQIIGKVISVHRKEAQYTVHGGMLGRATAVLFSLRKKALMLIGLFVRDAYYFLIDTGFIQRYIPSYLKPKHVLFQTKADTYHQKLILFQKEIGRYDTCSGTWKILPPFGLLIPNEIKYNN